MALLGHKVSVEGLRPTFPRSAPAAFKDLTCACWAGSPDERWVGRRLAWSGL